MLRCPACTKMISAEKLDKWFQCSQCECWLRLRVNSKTNTTWLQPGIHANGNITPVQFVQAAPVTPIQPASQAKSYEQSIPVAQISLESVRASRLEIASKLRTLDVGLKQQAGIMSANINNTDNIRKANNEITRLTEIEKELKEQDKELQELEAEKVRELAKTRNTKSNGGWAFGCFGFLIAVALIVFGQIVKIQWNSAEILWLLGISLAGGCLLWIGYNVFE